MNKTKFLCDSFSSGAYVGCQSRFLKLEIDCKSIAKPPQIKPEQKIQLYPVFRDVRAKKKIEFRKRFQVAKIVRNLSKVPIWCG